MVHVVRAILWPVLLARGEPETQAANGAAREILRQHAAAAAAEEAANAAAT